MACPVFPAPLADATVFFPPDILSRSVGDALATRVGVRFWVLYSVRGPTLSSYEASDDVLYVKCTTSPPHSRAVQPAASSRLACVSPRSGTALRTAAQQPTAPHTRPPLSSFRPGSGVWVKPSSAAQRALGDPALERVFKDNSCRPFLTLTPAAPRRSWSGTGARPRPCSPLLGSDPSGPHLPHNPGSVRVRLRCSPHTRRRARL